MSWVTLLSQVYHYDAQGQRSDQEFYHGDSGSWVGDRAETYEYDAQRGFLTAVDYNDGLAGEEPSWTYDLAGNRSTSGQSAWSYDDLNRLVSGGGYTYQSDIMGNRTWRNYGQSGVQRYVYDVLNRCTSVCGASDGARYEYRPDGLRVEKVSGLSVTWNPADRVHGSGWYDENWIINKATSRYFYDGQMCMEEDRVAVQYEEVYRTRYGLGPRGIDWMETSISGSQRNQQYPLYDGHGNMLATISLSGTLSNLRAYDAWGGVRDEASVTTDPNTRYCANLGHKQDDESGLIYMRARFYDAGTGRFISEDPAMQGTNWFVYCNNDPVNRVDASGKDYEWFNHLFHNAPQWFEDGMRAAWAQGGLAGIADFLEEHFRFANFALALGRQPVINASGMCLRLLIHEMKMAEFLEWGWLSVEQEGAIEYLVFDVEHIADLIMVAEEGDLLDL